MAASEKKQLSGRFVRAKLTLVISSFILLLVSGGERKISKFSLLGLEINGISQPFVVFSALVFTIISSFSLWLAYKNEGIPYLRDVTEKIKFEDLSSQHDSGILNTIQNVEEIKQGLRKFFRDDELSNRIHSSNAADLSVLNNLTSTSWQDPRLNVNAMMAHGFSYLQFDDVQKEQISSIVGEYLWRILDDIQLRFQSQIQESEESFIINGRSIVTLKYDFIKKLDETVVLLARIDASIKDYRRDLSRHMKLHQVEILIMDLTIPGLMSLIAIFHGVGFFTKSPWFYSLPYQIDRIYSTLVR